MLVPLRPCPGQAFRYPTFVVRLPAVSSWRSRSPAIRSMAGLGRHVDGRGAALTWPPESAWRIGDFDELLQGEQAVTVGQRSS